jgi:hypothetical protein
MDIMHACDFYTFPMAKKRKERENASKRLVYPNTLSHTSQNPHHTYLHSKNAIPSIVYVPCLYIQNHTPFYCAIRSSWESSSLR